MLQGMASAFHFSIKCSMIGENSLWPERPDIRESDAERRKPMLLVTTETIPGKELELLGMVEGCMIQSKHIGKDIGQSLKTMVGGELKSYTAMMTEAKDTARQRMRAEAEKLGADAVVNVRYATSAIVQGAAEIIAYGTAVRYR
jgi:uncharacterized protein YbjQ (UPF0145 family)